MNRVGEDSDNLSWSCNASRRVLVVDDDVQTAQDHACDLRTQGYEPIIAEGQGEALIADAKTKSRAYGCRVAIVDLALFGPGTDEAGLHLAKDLKPTACIIVTAYATIQLTNRANAHGSFVLEKGEDPDELLGRVKCAFEQFCPCNLQISGPGCDELRSKTLKDNPEASEEEIRCALVRLYRGESPSIAKVHLVTPDPPSTSQMSSSAPARAGAYIAEPIRADRVALQREVVKVAAAEKIKSEVSNYRQWIKGLLLPERCARIEDQGHSVTLWHIGAIRYTNIAREDRRLFRSWYPRASGEQVRRALEDLFNVTLRPLYKERGSVDVQSVYSYYVAHMFTPDFERRILDYCDQNSERFDAASLVGRALMLRNPVSWAYRHRLQSSFRSRWEAATHGDLHSGNIFVDQDCKTYVLDYERSGSGYILRDFAELETDIRLRLTPIPRDQLRLAYALDLALLAPVAGNDRLAPPDWDNLPDLSPRLRGELQKAFDAISTLRRLFCGLTGEPDELKQYYWALLMETLISLLRKYSDADASARNAARSRALLSAALIAERLAAWGGDWPPQDWPQPEALPARTEAILPVRVGEE